MTVRRGLVATIVAVLALAGSPGPADAQTADDNVAVAVNTEDGASVFRLAFSVRQVNNGVVDQRNAAVALASCTDCQTVALAFQVVLLQRDADVVVPENVAIAYNDQCILCTTYASATQLVLGFDSRVRFTGEGQRRLSELHRSLRQLEGDVATMSVAELDAAVQAAKAELVAILETELVAVERADAPPTTSSSTSSTSTSTTSSSTSSTASSSTSTTEGTTSTSSTSSSSTTTTTAPEESTTTTTEAA